MKKLDDLIKDGFYISEVKSDQDNIADYSLIGALKAYFSTAEDLDWYLSRKSCNILTEKDLKVLLVGAYARDACNAIIQFQHFFELFLKDILLKHDKLLVYDASQNPELLVKLIDKDTILDSELEKLHFIECSDAIERIKTLHKNRKLDSEYQFVDKYFELFVKLNRLRNRIAHRGAFIINPSALDEIFGRHVIPFVNELVGVVGYMHIKKWTFNLRNQYLNPFDAIVKEYSNSPVDENKVHLFKLIGAASYRNIIDYELDDVFGAYKEIREKAEKNAKTLAERQMIDPVECPVCGCKSFVREMDSFCEIDDKGEEIFGETFVDNIRCEQCGFHIENWLLNKLKDFSIPMPDYSEY